MFEQVLKFAPVALFGFSLLNMFGVKPFSGFYPWLVISTLWIFYCIVAGSYFLAAFMFGFTFWLFYKHLENPKPPDEEVK